jgi:hypothetical protein
VELLGDSGPMPCSCGVTHHRASSCRRSNFVVRVKLLILRGSFFSFLAVLDRVGSISVHFGADFSLFVFFSILRYGILAPRMAP